MAIQVGMVMDVTGYEHDDEITGTLSTENCEIEPFDQ